MYLNYLKLALRNLFRQRRFSLINIAGMAIAIACCLFILLYVFDELQYDKFNVNRDKICRVVFQNKITGEKDAIMPAVLFPKMLGEIPEFQTGFRVSKWPKLALKCNNKTFTEDLYFSDKEIFNVMTFPLERGNSQTALKDPFTVVLTKTAAQKYFGSADPVGKTLKVLNKYDFTVTGIMKDIPVHSHIRPELIASLCSFNIIEPRFMNDMTESGTYYYFMLKPNANLDLLKTKMQKVFNENIKDAIGIGGFVLEPLNDIYLYSTDTVWDVAVHGSINSVRIFIIVAILILFMASFNYTNILTVFVRLREKEFAVRKFLGAGRKNIFTQFFIETLSCFFVSLIWAIIIVELLMGSFNRLTYKEFNFSSLFQKEIILSIFGLFIFTTISSFIYPAVVVIKSSSLEKLKGNTYSSRFNPAKMQFGFRQIVTGVQFVITITLLIAAIVIFSQLNYMQNTNLGFNKEHLLLISNPYDKDMYSRYTNFANKIGENPQVLSVTAGGNVPSENVNNFTQVWVRNKKEGDGLHAGLIAIDYNYFKTLQAKITSGRDFMREYKTDHSEGVIINREAVKELKLKNPVGAELSGINNASDPQKVIGVVEDIHFRSFKEEVPPTIFYLREWSASGIVLKLKGDNIVSTMKSIEKAWNEVVPDQPFTYSFLDEEYDNLYKTEQQTSKIIFVFSLFAVIISSIGLFGLITLVSQTRRKEIGIRKVLGASIRNVLSLMMGEYLIIIAAANIIAWSAAYYLLSKWLNNFVYHIGINLWVFAAAGILTLLIALFSVGFQALSAAKANPVDSLRSE